MILISGKSTTFVVTIAESVSAYPLLRLLQGFDVFRKAEILNNGQATIQRLS